MSIPKRPVGLFKRAKGTVAHTLDVADIAIVSTGKVIENSMTAAADTTSTARTVLSHTLNEWEKESQIEALQVDMELELELRTAQVAYNTAMKELDKKMPK